MATFVQIDPTQNLKPFEGVKKLPLEEYFSSGHRTCQGCESALVMKMMIKAAGPRPNKGSRPEKSRWRWIWTRMRSRLFRSA